MARAAFLLACLIGLSGCEVMAVSFVGANMATLIHTDKTIPDIALSSQRGKDCSLLHASRNEPYCQSAPPDPTDTLAELADNRYCYRTLGRIDCYDRPDFLASGHTRVNFATGYLPSNREPASMAQRQAKGVPMAGIPAPAEPPLLASPAPTPAASSGKASGPAVKSSRKSMPAAKDTKKAPAALAAPISKKKKAGKATPPHKDAAVPTKVSLAATAVPDDPRIPGIPLAQVPPLVTLPGQGTY